MRGKLRTATADDFEAVYALLEMAHQEVKPFAINQAKARAFVGEVFSRGVVLAVEDGAALVGTAAIMGETPWWSDQVVVRGVWLYVLPEHRRSPYAGQLLRSMRTMAQRASLPFAIEFTAATGNEASFNRKRRLYEKCLGHPMGMSFLVMAGE